jgi:hypothetical protein
MLQFGLKGLAAVVFFKKKNQGANQTASEFTFYSYKKLDRYQSK